MFREDPHLNFDFDLRSRRGRKNKSDCDGKFTLCPVVATGEEVNVRFVLYPLGGGSILNALFFLLAD